MTLQRTFRRGTIVVAIGMVLSGSVALALPFSGYDLTGASKAIVPPPSSPIVPPGDPGVPVGPGAPTANPEPASLLLLGSGLAGLGWLRRRQAT